MGKKVETKDVFRLPVSTVIDEAKAAVEDKLFAATGPGKDPDVREVVVGSKVSAKAEGAGVLVLVEVTIL